MTHSPLPLRVDVPLPWRVEDGFILDANGYYVAEGCLEEISKIVTAVNAHAALVAALEEAILWDSHDDQGIPAVWLKQANAALDIARKGGA